MRSLHDFLRTTETPCAAYTTANGAAGSKCLTSSRCGGKRGNARGQRISTRTSAKVRRPNSPYNIRRSTRTGTEKRRHRGHPHGAVSGDRGPQPEPSGGRSQPSSAGGAVDRTRKPIAPIKTNVAGAGKKGTPKTSVAPGKSFAEKVHLAMLGLDSQGGQADGAVFLVRVGKSNPEGRGRGAFLCHAEYGRVKSLHDSGTSSRGCCSRWCRKSSIIRCRVTRRSGSSGCSWRGLKTV